MIFRKDTKSGSPKLTVQHDAYDSTKPWIKNETTLDGRPVPLYKYKEGLTIENTPRPYMEDVEPITDYASFKPGDRAPYVIGIKGAVWGGSKDDIVTKGTNDGKAWTVEFSRKLDTGNPDDIRLVKGEDAVFWTIVRDDGKGYATGGPVILRLDSGG